MIKINLLGDETAIDHSGKLILAAYVASVLLCLGVFGYLQTTTASQVSEMQAEVSGLQEDLAEIQATVASNQAEYDALVTTLEDINAEIQTLNDQGTRSESFLEGRRPLLEELFPQEPEVEEPQ